MRKRLLTKSKKRHNFGTGLVIFLSLKKRCDVAGERG